MAPGQTAVSKEVRETLERIAVRREELAARMTEQILIEVDEYSRADAVELIPAVDANCRDHFDSFVEYVLTGDLPPIKRGSPLSIPVFDRVRQGIRLDAYVHAFRVGQGVFWDEILAETGNEPDTALQFAGPSMSYIDRVCTRMAQIYLRASQQLRSEEERASRDLLEALLERTPLDESQTRRVAASGIDGRLVVAVLREFSKKPDTQEDALMAAVERSLRTLGTQGLVVARQQMLVIVIGLDEGVEVGIADTLRSNLTTDARCGISAEAQGIQDLGEAYDQAVAALKRTRPEERVVALAEVGALEYLMLTAPPSLAQMTSKELLAAIDPGTPEGAGLAETARVYLESELSAKTAAERLYIHANTLRYRLGLLEDRAGIDLRNFSDLVELRIALDMTRDRGSGAAG